MKLSPVRSIFALAAGLTVTGAALAPCALADGESQAQYKRVLVVSDDPSASAEQRLAIADGFASAIERAVNLNMGRVLYGRRAGTDPGGSTPLAFVIRTVQDINTALNETFMPNATYEKYLITQLEARAKSDPWVLGFDIRKTPLYSRVGNAFDQIASSMPQGTTRTLTYEILTVPAALELPEPAAGSVAARLRDSGMSLTGLMLQAARVGDAKEYDSVLALYDQADSFTAVDVGTAQAKNLYKIARDTYVDATKDDTKAWLPMYLEATLAYSSQGVQPRLRVILRPGPGMGGPVGEQGAAYDALPAADKVVQKTTLDYVPHLSFNSEAPAAMALLASSTFGGEEAKRPVVKVSFGRMNVPTDIRTITQCTTQCDTDLAAGAIGRHYPTINGIFRFEFIEAIPVDNSNKGFFGRLKDAVKQRVNAAINAGAAFAANTAEKANFHLMIQTLAIELGTDVLRVVPSESQFTLGIGDGKKAVTINPVSNSVGGVDLNMLGFDLYAKIGPEISASFSTEINAQFKNGKLINQKDFDAKQARFIDALGPITKALNTF